MSFFTNHGVFTKEQIKKQYDHMLRKFRPNIGDLGFSWIQHAKEFSLFNLQEIIPQVREWRKIGVKSFEYNNKEFEVEGRKWYVMIVQPYKNGEMEECGMCVVSMLLFSTWVNGYTYAFKTESDRDMVFKLLNAETDEGIDSIERTIYYLEQKAKEEAKEKQTKPTCCLCKKECENIYGNNPYPLVPERISDKGFARCCDACNRKEVIPARIEGTFRSEDITTDESRQVVLDRCAEIVRKQFNEVLHEVVNDLETKTPNDLLGELLHSQFSEYPTIKAIAMKCETLRDQLNAFREGGIEGVMEYVSQRFQRHLNCRSISSPKEICSTTKVACFQAFSNGMVGNQILTATKELQVDFNEATATIRKQIEDELVSTPSREKKEKKEKVMTEKERTRQANKAKAEEKKRKEEFERQSAIAQQRQEEQRKKKQREIAKKKRDAQLKSNQAVLEKILEK